MNMRQTGVRESTKLIFKNHYFLLRHGESVPNIRGVILSHLEEGKKVDHALTKNGEEQVRRSVQEAKAQGSLKEDTIIFSSPFSRCRRTAEIAKEVLGVNAEIIFDDRLRERWFGDWEGESNVHYQDVWDKDVLDPDHKDANVESTTEVVARVAGLIRDLEKRYAGKNILLVSHGDALQILQTFFEDKPSATHRELRHLKVGEVRRVS
jgi:probable phosphoglycerate mutase